MSRKDYVLIASIVAQIEDNVTRRKVAFDFANTLSLQSMRFDMKRFVTACRVEW